MAGFENTKENKAKPKGSDDFDSVTTPHEKLNGPTGPQQAIDGSSPAKKDAPQTAGQGNQGEKQVSAPAKPPGGDNAAGTPAAAGADKAGERKDGKDPKAEVAKGPEKPKPEDVLKNVNKILDTEIPALNKAGQLEKAKEAYEKAIKEAEKVSKEDIDKAKKDLVEVKKKLATETNVEELTKLKQRERELFSISRVKDAAYGNMALWYFRQGKVDEGTTKILQASGMDEKSAREHSKLNKEDQEAFLKNNPQAKDLTLLDDIYFQRQMTRMRDEKGVAVPEAYFNLHKAVRETNAQAEAQIILEAKAAKQAADAAAAKAGGDPAKAGADPAKAGADPAKAGADPAKAGLASDVSKGPQAATDKAGAPQEGPKEAPKEAPKAADAPFDAKAAEAKEEAARELLKKLDGDKNLKVTPEQRKVIEAGLDSFDQRMLEAGKQLKLVMPELAKVVGPEKLKDFLAKADTLDKEMNKIAQKDGSLKPEDMALIRRINGEPGEDREKAKGEMRTKYPEFSKSMDEFIAAAGGGEQAWKGFALARVANENSENLKSNFAQGITGRTVYGEALVRAGDIPAAQKQVKKIFEGMTEKDAKDLIMGDGKNIPPDERLGNLLKDTGMDAAAATKPETMSSNVDMSKPLAERVKGMSFEDLMQGVSDANAKGPEGVREGRAYYEEVIRRADDPTFIKERTDKLKANQAMLEADKKADGTPLTAQDRTDLHTENTFAIKDLALPAEMRFQYAMYLGDQANRQAIIQKTAGAKDYVPGSVSAASREFIEGGNNQLASMQKIAEEAFKKADGLPRDLINKEAQLQTRDIGRVADEKQLSECLAIVKGGSTVNKDGFERKLMSIADLGIEQRLNMAWFYLQNDKTNMIDNQLTGNMNSQRPPDALYKPQEAAKLAEQAGALYNQYHQGKPADQMYDYIVQVGMQKSPEMFRKAATLANDNFASPKADAVAMVGAFIGDYGLKGLAMWASKGHIKPAALEAAGDVGAIAAGIGGRALAYRGFSGRWENLEDSAVHGTAAGLATMAFKYSSKQLMGSNFMAARTGNLNEVNVARGIAGEGAIGSKFGEELVKVGKVKPADLAKAKAENPELFNKQLTNMSPEEVGQMYNSLGIGKKSRAELLDMMIATGKAKPDVLGQLEGLRASGAKSAQTLEAKAREHNARVSSFMTDVEKTAIGKERGFFAGAGDKLMFRNPNTKIESVVEDVAKANPAKYPNKEAIAKEVEYLKKSGINTLGDARGSYLVAHNADMTALLADPKFIALTQPKSRGTQVLDKVRGDSQSLTAVIKEMKAQYGDQVPAYLTNIEQRVPVLQRMGINNMSEFKDAAGIAIEMKSMEQFRSRFPELTGTSGKNNFNLSELKAYARPFGERGSTSDAMVNTLLGKAPETAPGIFSRLGTGTANILYRDRFYNVTDHYKAFLGKDARNAGRINPETSSLAAMERAAAQTRGRVAMVSAGAASVILRGGGGVYDKVLSTDPNGNKRTWQDSSGKTHEYTVPDALTESLVGRGTIWERMTGSVVSDVLLGSFVLKPVVGSMAGKGSTLAWVTYQATTRGMDGHADGAQANYLNGRADTMEKPLEDAALPGTGTVAEDLAAKQEAAAKAAADKATADKAAANATEADRARAAKAAADNAAAEKEAADRAAADRAKAQTPSFDPSALSPGEGY